MKYLSPISLPQPKQKSRFFAATPTLSIKDDEYASIGQARARIFMGAGIFALALFLLIARLAEVSLFHTPRLAVSMTTSAKYRADITDRNGKLLATTIKTYSLSADPRKVWDAVASTEAITSVLADLDTSIVEEKLTSDKSFVWIRRNLTPAERQAVFALGLPELAFQVEPRRVYPRGRLAAHVLGFTDIDMNGTAGVERAFDENLSKEAVEQVQLSLDMRVQFAVEEELHAGMEKFQADGASGIVLNIKTGEVLAMASLPNFDPNQSAVALPNSLLNRASSALYELGSTFKPITIALASESGVVKDGEMLPVQNKLVVQKKSIKDDHPSHVALNLRDVLAKSSNRGSAMIALRSGGAAQQELLRKLGLFARVPIELKESAAPLLPREWQNITTATVSYGHGITVTPLALATALASLINGGDYISPTILKSSEAANDNPEPRRVVSKQTSRLIVDMMRYVVTNGTGRNAAVPGYELMGKTGTAEKLVGGQYDKKRLVTSFVAAFPHRDPTYLVFIVYDEPKAAHDTYGYATAGWNAARTAGSVVERIAPQLGIKRIVENAKLANTKTGGGR